MPPKNIDLMPLSAINCLTALLPVAREDGGDSDYVHEDDDASWHEFDEAQAGLQIRIRR